MPGAYEQLTDLPAVLARASELSLRTLVFDVEPLVAWWDTGQQALDQGIAEVIGSLDQVPSVQAMVFATNSARTPTMLPPFPGVRVSYLAMAGKPFRTAPYRGLPRPGAVIGDQLPTDGLLAYRLGFTFLHCDPRLGGVPLGPRLMRLLGRPVRPLFFRGAGAPGGTKS
jgi:predicted HAD superfamily phosphohydrolase YqeG